MDECEYQDAADWETKLRDCEKKVKELEGVCAKKDGKIDRLKWDYRALDRKHRELCSENRQTEKRGKLETEREKRER